MRFGSLMINMCKFSQMKYIFFFICLLGLYSCEREISFDYPTSETKVIFDGIISNEGVSVRISRTRPIGDKQKGQPVSTAQVWIVSDDGEEEQLVYDEQKGCYTSVTGLVGIPGHEYQMKAVLDGHHYEATSLMQDAVVVDTAYFRSVKILQDRLYFYCVKGVMPTQDKRVYHLCKLLRGDEVFRWNPWSGRGIIDGRIEYDIICSSESDMDKGIDDEGLIPLMEGDTIRMELLTIDRACWDYYQSLVVSELMTANPLTNIKGGAEGIFMAAGIARPDTIVFRKKDAY